MPTFASNWKTLVFVILSAAAALFLARSLTDIFYPMEQARIDFEGASFHVDLARTAHQLKRGLQNRRQLESNRGMLFHFPRAQAVQIWMKDTFIALDIIWMDGNLRVLHIEDSAPPCREGPCPNYAPKAKVSYVLEINAGQARRADIEIGNRASLSVITDN